MDNDGIKDLIIQVISSWQVIVVTLIILIYISLVNYVTRTKRRKRNVVKNKVKKAKPAAAPKDEADTSELGLEE
jgi:hypothetical protein